MPIWSYFFFFFYSAVKNINLSTLKWPYVLFFPRHVIAKISKLPKIPRFWLCFAILIHTVLIHYMYTYLHCSLQMLVWAQLLKAPSALWISMLHWRTFQSMHLTLCIYKKQEKHKFCVWGSVESEEPACKHLTLAKITFHFHNK